MSSPAPPSNPPSVQPRPLGPPAPPSDPSPQLAPPTQPAPAPPAPGIPPTANDWLNGPPGVPAARSGRTRRQRLAVATVVLLVLACVVGALALLNRPRTATVELDAATERPADASATTRAMTLIDTIVTVNGRGDASAACDLVTHRLALYLSGFTTTCEDTLDWWWLDKEPAFAPIDVRPGDVRVDARRPDLTIVRVPPERAPSGPRQGNVYLLVEQDGTLLVDAVLAGWEAPLDVLLREKKAEDELDKDRQGVDPRRARSSG